MAALIDAARAFTPRFEQVGPLLLLDTGGLSRMFGTPQELGTHLREALGPAPRIALASTQTTAALLALGRPGLTIVELGKDASALAPLSVSVLDKFERLSSIAPLAPLAPLAPSAGPRPTGENGQLDVLTKWGIHSMGALAALPGPDVYERLGDRGVRWQALARGEDQRPMVPWVDEVPFEAALELEWPIEGLEPLSFVLARLLEPLAERLERADRGATLLTTSLRLTTRTVFTRTVHLPAPMRDPKTLRTLILLDLETHPPTAPIDIVRVDIGPTPARILQWTLLERAQPAPEKVSTLLARLTALMGEGHVGSPALVDSWRPGDFRVESFELGVQSSEPTLNSEPLTLNSAFRRFRFPIPTRVQVREGRPVRVVTDRQGMTGGAIVQAAGPWRTSGEWWSEPWDRDEWDVSMTDGTLYRLVVERSVGQWFLEGVMD